MKPTQQDQKMDSGKSGRFSPRLDHDEELAATDDIGLPQDTSAEDARSPQAVQPDPTRMQAGRGDAGEGTRAPGRVPLEENQKHPSDPLKPGEEDEYGTRLEKAISKVVPPGHEVKDEDILDPGHMTPNARPVDNRS